MSLRDSKTDTNGCSFTLRERESSVKLANLELNAVPDGVADGLCGVQLVNKDV